MIETVVSVKLPVRETLRIKKNSLHPEEKRESASFRVYMEMSLEDSIYAERS